MRKLVFQMDPTLFLVLYFAPLLLMYFLHGFPFQIRLPLMLISLFVELIWYWQMNKAVSQLTEEKSGSDTLLNIFIVAMFANNLLWVAAGSMRYPVIKEYLEGENILSIRMATLYLKFLLWLIVAVLMTIRLKKVLTERTTWFMFMELMLPVLAMINITPLIRDELKSKNYL